jgi:hypothetical protein
MALEAATGARTSLVVDGLVHLKDTNTATETDSDSETDTDTETETDTELRAGCGVVTERK